MEKEKKAGLIREILSSLAKKGINQEIFFQNDFKPFQQIQDENELIQEVISELDLKKQYPNLFQKEKSQDEPWRARSNCFHKIFPEPFSNRYVDMLKMEVQQKVLFELTYRCFDGLGVKTIEDFEFINLPEKVAKRIYHPEDNIYASPVLFNKNFDEKDYFVRGYIRLSAIGKGGTGNSYKGNLAILKKISSQGEYALVSSNWGDVLIGNQVIIKQLLSYDHYSYTLFSKRSDRKGKVELKPRDNTQVLVDKLSHDEKHYYEKIAKEKYESFLKRLTSEIEVIYALTRPDIQSSVPEERKNKTSEFSELENEIKLDDDVNQKIQKFLLRTSEDNKPYGTNYVVELLDDHLAAKIFIMKAVENAQDLSQVYDRFNRHINMNLSFVFTFEIGMGLQYIHQNKIIHRDLKDKNIIISPTGQVVIIDYGEAINNALSMSTGTGAFGTPVFMAPEQIMGQVSYKSDIYSLGLILAKLMLRDNLHSIRPLQVKKQGIIKKMLNYLFGTRAVTTRSPLLRTREDIFTNFKFICKGNSKEVKKAGENYMVYNDFDVSNHLKMKKFIHYNLKLFYKKLLQNAMLSNNSQIDRASAVLAVSKNKIKGNIPVYDKLYRLAVYLNLDRNQSLPIRSTIFKLPEEEQNQAIAKEYNLDINQFELKTRKQKLLTMEQVYAKIDESFNVFFKDYFQFLRCDKNLIRDIYVGDYDGNGIDDTLIFVGSFGKVLDERGFHSDRVISPFPLRLKSKKGKARIFSINDIYNNIYNTEIEEHKAKINGILRRSLACYPRDRYKNVSEILKDIGEIAFDRNIYNPESEKAKIYGLLKIKGS
jgi:serine/threonine protein kinase